MSTPDAPVAGVVVPRPRRALYPMVVPRTMLLPVLDTNALLTHACYLVKKGSLDGAVSGLADTGRANPYIASHVPGELAEHLPKLATHYQVPVDAVRALLVRKILPSVRVVELEIRDHLAPQTRHVLHGTVLGHPGDPDDVPTMALAEFLAPSVIVAADKVFSTFGLAVLDWIPMAQDLLRMAGLEANAADALVAIDFGLKLFGLGVKALATLAGRYPVPSAVITGAVLWFCRSRGYLRGEDWRRRTTRAWEIAEPYIERTGAAIEEHARLRDSLLVVDPPPYPTNEQLAARHLARCGQALTPGELRDALAGQGQQISAAALKRAMLAHGAFVRAPGDVWTVGRPAGKALASEIITSREAIG
jgi:hypothetical protein